MNDIKELDPVALTCDLSAENLKRVMWARLCWSMATAKHSKSNLLATMGGRCAFDIGAGSGAAITCGRHPACTRAGAGMTEPVTRRTCVQRLLIRRSA